MYVTIRKDDAAKRLKHTWIEWKDLLFNYHSDTDSIDNYVEFIKSTHQMQIMSFIDAVNEIESNRIFLSCNGLMPQSLFYTIHEIKHYLEFLLLCFDKKSVPELISELKQFSQILYDKVESISNIKKLNIVTYQAFDTDELLKKIIE